MRNVFVVILFLGLASSAVAQYSNLIVYTENGMKFKLVVNGVDQNTEYANVAMAKNIEGDNCYVQVYFEDTTIPRVNKDLRLLPGGDEFSLLVKKKKKGFILKKVSSKPIIVGIPSYNDFALKNNSSNDFNKDLLPDYKGRVVGTNPMTAKEFQEAHGKIHKDTDSDKQLAEAKKVLESKTMIVSQILAIMNDFTFDYTKLQFAKFAWLRTYDVNNFGLVVKNLENTNYQAELRNFVLQNPR